MRFARVHIFYILAMNLSNVFISAFLITSGSSFTTVGVFYLLNFGFETCGYFAAGSLSKRFKLSFIACSGLFFYAAGYLALLLLRDRTAALIPLTAFLISWGTSFYWFAYHNNIVNYTDPDTRQTGLSFLGMVNNFLVLTAPPVSGFIMSRLRGMNGYVTVFAVSLTCFVSAAVVCRRLLSSPTGRSNVIINFFRRDFLRKRNFLILIVYFFYGIRDGVFSYYLNLIVFGLSSSGYGTMILGFNMTGRALMSMLMYFLLSAKLTRRQSISIMTALAFIWPFVISLLHFNYYPAAVFLFTIADAAVQIFLYNGMLTTNMELCDLLSGESGGVSRRAEVVGVYHVLLCSGRMVSCLLFLLIPAAQAYPVWALAGLMALTVPGVICLRMGRRMMAGK